MTFKLPKLPEPFRGPSVETLAQRFYEFAQNAYEFMRGIPQIEFKTFRADGTYPIYVETLTKVPQAVIRVRSYDALDPSVVISDTSIAWSPSDDPDMPGILVSWLGGIPISVGTSVAEYEVVLLVLGERA